MGCDGGDGGGKTRRSSPSWVREWGEFSPLIWVGVGIRRTEVGEEVRRAAGRFFEFVSALVKGIVSALGKGIRLGGASAAGDRWGRGGFDLGGEEGGMAGENRWGGNGGGHPLFPPMMLVEGGGGKVFGGRVGGSCR
jgi:hypothetical protein